MLINPFLSITYYEFIFNFMIYSFLGWLMEVILCSIQDKKFINRGFLVGPLCPIYGFGMNIIIILLHPLTKMMTAISVDAKPYINYLLLYIGAVITTTALEYFVSWLLETAFKTRWWDYSHHRFNIKGRVSLSISLAWGVLAVILIAFIQPVIIRLIYAIPYNISSTICYIFIAFFIVDTVYSIVASAKLTYKMATFAQLASFLKESIKVSWEESNVAWKEKWEESNVALKEKLANVKLTQLLTEYKSSTQATDKDRMPISKRLQKYFVKAKKEGFSPSFSDRRILKAFPKMQSKKYNHILKELRDRINKNGKQKQDEEQDDNK